MHLMNSILIFPGTSQMLSTVCVRVAIVLVKLGRTIRKAFVTSLGFDVQKKQSKVSSRRSLNKEGNKWNVQKIAFQMGSKGVFD